MGNVTELSGWGSDVPALLTETTTGGLLGGRLLAEEPVVEYLLPAEQPSYLLRNKKRGVVREQGEGTERIEPDAELQALCVVTDVRLLAVVGQEDGDASLSVALSEIVSVDVEDSMLGGDLAVVTADGDRVRFPCRGDLNAVADRIDEGAQAWARAYTLLDRARARRADAETLREADAFGAAVEALDEARESLAGARDRLAAFGDGALAELQSEVTDLESRLEDGRLSVQKARGEQAIGSARKRWEDRRYDAAYDAYAEAEEAFERAAAVRETEEVTERLTRVREEWSNLEVAPVAYAEAMAAEARETDRPATAAQCWEVALDRYRDVYALDWGRAQARFDVQREGVRTRILEILDSAVECRLAAAETARSEAAELRREGATVAARERLERAQSSLERTADLVAELRQDDSESLRAERRRLAAALGELETTNPAPTARSGA